MSEVVGLVSGDCELSGAGLRKKCRTILHML